ASPSTTQNAGRWLLQVGDPAEKLTVRNTSNGKPKIRMVEEVEELETYPQQALLPTGDPGGFHNGKVGVEVTWAAEAIVPLGESHSGAVTDAGRSQVAGIKPGLASRLHEVGVRIGLVVRQHLWRLARVRSQRKSRAFATRWP